MKTTEENIKRVALYLRVSTVEQSKKFGIPAQKKDLLREVKHRAETQGWKTRPEWIYVDEGISGSHLDRPEFKRMMEDVKQRKFDVVAVWRIDRLSRTLTNLLEIFERLDENKVEFFSYKENFDMSGPIGKLVFQIFGALAEFERKNIFMRTSEGKKTAASLGYYPGSGIPYGYRSLKKENERGSKLVIVPKEAKMVRQIFDWFIAERKYYAQIARDLNDLKIRKGVAGKKSNKNTEWDGDAVKRILQNRSYTGIYLYGGKDEDEKPIEVEIPRIISDFKYEQAQRKIEEVYTQKKNRGRKGKEYLLSKKIFDVSTGFPLKPYYVTKTKKLSYKRQKWTNPKTGEEFLHIEIPGKALEEFVWEHVKLAIQKPKRFFKLYQKQTSKFRKLESLKKRRELYLENIEEQQSIMVKVDYDMYTDHIDEKERDRRTQQASEVIRAANKNLEAIEKEIDQLVEVQMAKKALESFAQNFEENVDKLTFKQKKVLVDMLIKRIEVEKTSDSTNVTVIFEFDHPSESEDIELFELKKNLNKPKKAPNRGDSLVDGGR